MIDVSFKDALSNAGLNTRDNIIADGKLRRFQVDGDKPRSLNGWYVLFGDGVPAGCFGSWKTGEKHNWHLNGYKSLTGAEKATHIAKMRKAHKEREAEDKRRKAQAAIKANSIWDEASACLNNHPYLVKKNVKSYGLRVSDNKLIMPMQDVIGTIHSIQTIDELGNKRFLSGGRKKGCFYLIGSPQSELYIAEGYATAATIYAVTGVAIAVAFDAGNLMHVAKAWRAKHPVLSITICADNDTQSPKNTGVMKADTAALAVGGAVAIPPCHGDFNDYYNGIQI